MENNNLKDMKISIKSKKILDENMININKLLKLNEEIILKYLEKQIYNSTISDETIKNINNIFASIHII